MNESTISPAAARLARERRIHALRMRVVAIAVSLFLAAWAGLFVQLISGHDPALASSTTAVATQSADPEITDDGWADDDSSAALTDSDATSSTSANAELNGTGSASSQSSAPAAVTTGQS